MIAFWGWYKSGDGIKLPMKYSREKMFSQNNLYTTRETKLRNQRAGLR